VGHQGDLIPPSGSRRPRPHATSSALEYDARAAAYNHFVYNEPRAVLIAQRWACQATPGGSSVGYAVAHVYAIPNHRIPAHVVGLSTIWRRGLTVHLREKINRTGPQSTLPPSPFIDELAAKAKPEPCRVPHEGCYRQH